MSGFGPIAIVGVGGIFPGATDLEAFWRHVQAGHCAAREVPEGRWALAADRVHDPRPGAPDRVYSKRICPLEPGSGEPDYTTLQISREELERLDPLFRLLVAAGQQAWRDGGGERWDPTRVGVVVGNLVLPTDAASALSCETLGRTFAETVDPEAPLERAGGTEPRNRYVAGLPAGILARALGLGGGSHTLDAACASSLYALKLAADELHAGRADAMLAGGVSRPSSLYTQMGFSQLRALSPTGVPAPFSADGDGLVVGEGAGLFALKRLADAERDGDRIHGVIRGIGLSNDVGGRLLAPTSEGQLRAMRAAYEQAGWDPADVDLIECHATGIPMGDAVEFESLRTLWGGRSAPEPCVIGSVKSNIGHLLTAAAAAALAKVLCALRDRVLPPTANFAGPPASLGLAESPFRVLSEARPWPERGPGKRRRAAISAFGFGGINAHLLLEEHAPAPSPAVPTPVVEPVSPVRPAPVAIVGMDAWFGPWEGLRAFQERVLNGRVGEGELPAGRWWGARRCAWFREQGYDRIPFKGYFIKELNLPLDRFRIPPKELEEMLPQQLLMLQVATRAWFDAGLDARGDMRSGVFVGLGLDMNTTNFHVRWNLVNEAARWNRRLNLHLDREALERWTRGLRDSCGPPLTANRTMGALGSVVASRIARELRLGGPSFSISSEETSGMLALRAGVEALRQNTVDRSLVGAVDLAGDLRAVLGSHLQGPHSPSGTIRPFDLGADGTVVGEGAVALTLKRLDDALADGDRVYGVIRGLGVAGAVDGSEEAVEEAYTAAMQRAFAEASVDPATVGYIDAHGSGVPREDGVEARALAAFYRDSDGGGDEDRWHLAGPSALGSVKGDIGHAGAAAALASVAKACLCLYQEVIPPLRNLVQPTTGLLARGCAVVPPQIPLPWVHNRACGPRRAAVSALGVEGNCAHLVLEALERKTQLEVVTPSTATTMDRERRHPLGAPREALFNLAGADPQALAGGLRRLRAFVERRAPEVGNRIDRLGGAWFREMERPGPGTPGLALVARSVTELLEQITFTLHHLEREPDRALGGRGRVPSEAIAKDRIFYAPRPLRAGAPEERRIAFVYPGSGNQYPDMGRELLLHWPEVLRDQHERNRYLRGQLVPQVFWNPQAWSDERREQTLNNHKAMILGQVALGTAVSDLLVGLGVHPEAVVGYSLGETAGLFSLGAWRDRDEMLKRVHDSTLFTKELAGEFQAARKRWKLMPEEAADWVLGVIDRPMSVLKTAIKNRKAVYGLIANTLHECVVGGKRKVVQSLVDMLQCEYIPLDGVTTAHCEIVQEVEKPYRDLHLFKVDPPPGVRFYSGAWGRHYEVTRERAADAILAHALQGVDYPKTIEAAYADGVRLFLEMGPGGSCTRMIGNILGDRPHLARTFCAAGPSPVSLVLRGLGNLLAEGVSVDLEALYGPETPVEVPAGAGRSLVVTVGGRPLHPPSPDKARDEAAPGVGGAAGPVPATPVALPQVPLEGPAPAVPTGPVTAPVPPALAEAIRAAEQARAEAHEAYLQLSSQLHRAMSRVVGDQIALAAGVAPSPASAGPVGTGGAGAGEVPPAPAPVPAPVPDKAAPALNREGCLEFARGRVSRVWGERFARVDTFPTRVRLPDEPLMLVDRVVTIEGEALSLTRGRIVTEHDVWPGSWYLDGGRAPVCITVEAGQADLMLSGWLGIDLVGEGLATYRLLDAEITFHRHLPQPGEVIRYDIRILNFFDHNGTRFFRFQFDGTIGGEPVLTMRNGCAGFFTEAELDAGQGIVRTRLQEAPTPGRRPEDWRPLAPLAVESYDEGALDALRAGDLEGCFGSAFAGLTLGPAMRLPGGRMRLVHRVTRLEPEGGRYGLGRIEAEADIRPDDWFLTCHFVDDKVMPGTLMYECCLHTLRIHLLRMGWIDTGAQGGYEAVPGVTSRLQCRGQVLESTRTVTYEVILKELGYRPEPYAIADAKMYADGRPIVFMEDMSIRFTGLDRATLEALWAERGEREVVDRPALYDHDRILAFAVGRPSEAFGEPYRVFDEERVIARLPGPPYEFIDKITAVEGEPWRMVAGARATAHYVPPADAWYFRESGDGTMPFAVLLEIGLQPCGWLAAYVGSALTSPVDLSFRNLGGEAVQRLAVSPDTGLLETRVKLTGVSSSGGMIIQEYDLEIACAAGTVYRGRTTFGFFTKEALANQVGLQGVDRWQPATAVGTPQDYPRGPGWPGRQLCMLDRVTGRDPAGGPAGLGWLQGTKRVDPAEWFFAAHFHQDPVMPGSLGLEAFVQLLGREAVLRWGDEPGLRPRGVVVGEPHKWTYRGQVLPTDGLVTTEAYITMVDEERRLLRADGLLEVDGRLIYRMQDFTIALEAGAR